MSTLGSRLVCLMVAGMGGLFVSAADYNQTVDLGTRCSGDAVNATATPPGTVLTGGVSNPGGFTWNVGPASFADTIPLTFSGSHAGKFSGTYRPNGQGSGGEPPINTWEMDTAAMVVKVDLIPVPAGNTPELVNGRICINAQSNYKKAKWKAVVKPSGTTATVAPVSGGVTISGGSGISDGATFWVAGGTTTGDYKIRITHDSCASCTATGGENVFKLVVKSKDTGHVKPSAQTTPAYLKQESPSVISVGAFCYFDGFAAPPLTKTVSGWAYHEASISTEPANMYSGKIQAKTRLAGNQVGLLQTFGIVGFDANGNRIAFGSTRMHWTGKITLSGGGLAAPLEFSDGGYDSAAPFALVVLRQTTPIDYEYDNSFTETYIADNWMTYRGDVELSFSSGGLIGGGWCHTTLDGPSSHDYLYLLGGSGLPTMSDYAITN